jgi:gephyrin
MEVVGTPLCAIVTAQTLYKCAPVRLFSGNPVSSIVCFHLFVRAAIEKLAGHAAPGLRRVHGHVTSDIKLDPERPEYHRVALAWRTESGGDPGHFVASSTGFQRSSRLLSVRSTTGLLELPRGTPEAGSISAGSAVPCLLIGDLQGMPV